MNNLSNLLVLTQEYVTNLLTDELPSSITYHNLSHTQSVVEASRLIGKGNQLKEQQLNLLSIAAWFHDTGHVISSVAHERESIKIAKDFLASHLSSQELHEVILAIEATIMPQNPQTLLGRCLCDADLYDLSLPSFYENSLLLRQEWQNIFQKNYTDKEWIAQNLNFLETHHYHTVFAQNYCLQGKKENILKMQNFLKTL